MDVGYEKIVNFSFSQEQVIRFAAATGDNNPLHLDDNYAKKTIFKRKIVHGFLSASIFSKIFGTYFPGTIYLEQNLKFKKPMFVLCQYCARINILATDPKKHTALVNTEVFENNTDVITIEGQATIMNMEVL